MGRCNCRRGVLVVDVDHTGDGLGLERFDEVLAELRDAEFWASPETRTRLLAMVPEYRLSKFQRVLPDRLQVEMLGAYLLDFEGTSTFLRAPDVVADADGKGTLDVEAITALLA